MRCIASLFLLIAFATVARSEVDRMHPGAPNPADAIKTFELPEGFVIELVAAEPLVMDPVAFAWGPDGKFWVVEMADYNHLPINDRDPKKPRGRVVYLTDSDNNGTYDKRHVFLDDLNYPNGIMPWRDGVLITAAPDILFAADTTPDDDNFKADKREMLYTGFGEGNPQLRVNGLAWGLDNWIYCANGFSHGKVKSTKTGKVIDISGRDVRIRPDTGEIEHATGPSQFGRVRDDYGNWFGVNNSDLIRHYVLPDHYLRRNPHVKYPDPVVSLVTPRNPPLFARGERVDRFHAPYMAGRFTSACGLHIYRDTLLGADYYHNAFVCEPVHNLITRRVLKSNGVTFKAERAKGEEQREWLTSTDNWFRPAMVRTGPDGAIWIADMYRAVIEHAQWAPKEVHELFALRHGHERGRIYRVYRKSNTIVDAEPIKPDEFTRAATARLIGPLIRARKPVIYRHIDRMKDEEIIPLLGDRNGYVRDLASMMLLWRDNLNAIDGAKNELSENKNLPDDVRKARQLALDATILARQERIKTNRYMFTNLLVDGGPGVSDVGRLHALSVLNGMRELRQSNLRFSWSPINPDALDYFQRLNEQFDEPIISAVPRDRKMRMQLAFSLGEHHLPKAGALLGDIMRASMNEPYILAAAMSSAPPHLSSLTTKLLSHGDNVPLEIIESLAGMIVAEKKQSLLLFTIDQAATLTDTGYAVRQYSTVAALLDAMSRKGQSLEKLGAAPGNAQWSGASKVQAMVTWVADRKHFDALPTSAENQAMRLFGRLQATRTNESTLIASMLRPDIDASLQQAAIDAITRHGDEAIKSLLLDAARWKTFTPALRSRIVLMLLQRSSRIALLLDAVESETVNAVEIDAAARQRLIASKTATIRDRAKKLLGNRQTDRAKLVAQFADVLTMQGDTTRGRTLYDKTCAACHRLAGEGKGVAPDLSSLSDRSTKFMLANILDPNAAVDSRYINYICETAEGDTLTGMLVSETGGSLTLVGPNGDKHVILRKDVVSLRSTNLSLMPEGLEQQLGKQGLTDVIAYVQYRSQPPRPLAGVKPRVYSPGADGSIVLTCRNLEAFGTAVNYEKEDNNIGNWTSANDYLVWQIDVKQAGKYEVWFDYAAEDAWKGNKVSLSARNEAGETGRIEAAVKTTGSQDRYVQSTFGVISLAAGRQEVTLRAGGKITGELMDLRGVRLMPVK